jgi:hypothetical protein
MLFKVLKPEALLCVFENDVLVESVAGIHIQRDEVGGFD